MAVAFDITMKNYLSQIDKSPLLSYQQEQQLGKLVREQNDPQAREKLVRSNLRLVVKIAKDYAGRDLGLAELVEEGNLGLIKAVDYFDPDRGVRFSSYAAWWIRQTIKRALLMNTQPIHIPTYMMALINHWRHTATEVENTMGRAHTIKEIAEIMKLPMKKAEVIAETVNALSSIRNSALNGQNPSDTQDPDNDWTADDNSRPEDDLEQNEEKEKAVKLLDKIDSREAKILKLHYGLDGKKEMSLKEIADMMGLTRERIRQIQRAALTRLYQYMDQQ